ncbi:hypothetical protein ScPMuIL_010646 [Solemya velum]
MVEQGHIMNRFVWCSVTLYVFAYTDTASGLTMSDYKNHSCTRPCEVGELRTCEYNFTVEHYFTLSKACYNCPYNQSDCDRPHCIPADGVKRGILVVNRMLPGPAIQVCEGDMIVVNLHNKMATSEGTAIHWHGIHQRNYQHMDGLGMVTQCPIPAGAHFQYRFPADYPGTHFWHAHVGMQRSDGVFGALVTRQTPVTDPHFSFYDLDLPEHTIFVNDWLNELTLNRFSHHHQAGGDNKPSSMLIQGRGRMTGYMDTESNKTSYTPYSKFDVERGRRYRFRIISNGILNCPIQVSIDDHSLMMIASDGNSFEPLEVESFNIYAGERFDFVLRTDQETGNYWIRTRGLADCGEQFKGANQAAILRYKDADDVLPPGDVNYELAKRGGKKLNPLNQKGTEELIPVAELNSTSPSEDWLQRVPDMKFYIGMDFEIIDNTNFHDPELYPISALERGYHLYSPQMNYISNMLPPAPLLTQHASVPTEMFCDESTVKWNCSEKFCECVHLLAVPLGSVVEMVLVDEGKPFDANHPIHLHGYKFMVVGMDRLNKSTTKTRVKYLDETVGLPRKLNQTIAKDTVTVPDGGYTIIRFLADNPGFWFLHCHNQFHADIGMGLFVQVGEISQMPKTPRGFPRCGSWQPSDHDNDDDDDEKKYVCSGEKGTTTQNLVALILFPQLMQFYILN